jgi:hypothetical protein
MDRRIARRNVRGPNEPRTDRLGDQLGGENYVEALDYTTMEWTNVLSFYSEAIIGVFSAR